MDNIRYSKNKNPSKTANSKTKNIPKSQMNVKTPNIPSNNYNTSGYTEHASKISFVSNQSKATPNQEIYEPGSIHSTLGFEDPRHDPHSNFVYGSRPLPKQTLRPNNSSENYTHQILSMNSQSKQGSSDNVQHDTSAHYNTSNANANYNSSNINANNSIANQSPSRIESKGQEEDEYSKIHYTDMTRKTVTERNTMNNFHPMDKSPDDEPMPSERVGELSTIKSESKDYSKDYSSKASNIRFDSNKDYSREKLGNVNGAHANASGNKGGEFDPEVEKKRNGLNPITEKPDESRYVNSRTHNTQDNSRTHNTLDSGKRGVAVNSDGSRRVMKSDPDEYSPLKNFRADSRNQKTDVVATSTQGKMPVKPKINSYHAYGNSSNQPIDNTNFANKYKPTKNDYNRSKNRFNNQEQDLKQVKNSLEASELFLPALKKSEIPLERKKTGGDLTLDDTLFGALKSNRQLNSTQKRSFSSAKTNASFDFGSKYQGAMPKVEQLKMYVLPLPQSALLAQLLKSQLNIPEFKYVVERLTNDFVERVDFSKETFRATPYFQQFLQFVKELSVFVNTNVVFYMSENLFDPAYVLLSIVRILVELNIFDNLDFFEEKCLVYNNVSVCLKHYGMYYIALKYMTLVLHFEKYRKTPNYENVILAEINICAILSQLSKHKDASTHSIIAIKILQTIEDKGLVDHGEQPAEGVQYALQSPRFYELKAIALYNIACEFEYMNDQREALNYYKMSIETYEKNSAGRNEFLNHLKKGYTQCRDQVLKFYKQKPISRDPVISNKLNKAVDRETYHNNIKLAKNYYENENK